MIRKAVETDIDRIDEIFNSVHVLEETGVTCAGWKRNVYPTHDTAVSAIKSGEMFVYESDGIIKGTAVINKKQATEYSMCPWRYRASDDEVMVIHTLSVDPAYRKQGVATALIKFYEEYAAAEGCTNLRLDTNRENTPARRLYLNLGYTEAEVVPCLYEGIENLYLMCYEKKIK